MKKLLIIFFALIFTGCLVTTGEITKLEQKVTDIEEMVLLGATQGAGANFYPASAGLIGGEAGKLDKITGTVDKDAAMVLLNDHGTYGNAIFFYGLDANGAGTEAVPMIVDSGDAGDEDWELCSGYFDLIYGKMPWGTEITGNITLGDTLTEVYGVAYQVSVACTITLEKASTVGYGAPVLIYSQGANTIIIDVDNADIINLHGTPLTAGFTIDSPGNAGDFIVLVSTTDANGSGTDGWITMGYAEAVWTDGGAT